MKEKQITQKQNNKKLKDKEKPILDLLFKFRHLNQPQIQHLLNHKAKERIRTRLNDLAERQYIFKIYKKEFGGIPSAYCLDKESVGYGRDQGIDEKVLKRLYYEKTHSPQFRKHCMFVATIFLSLREFAGRNNLRLRFHSKADLYGMLYMILPNPDAFFDLQEENKKIKRYFLETFDDNTFIKKRIYQYLYYCRKRYWQDSTKKQFPEVIFVLPTQTVKQNTYKFIQRRLTDNAPSFYLTTKEDIQTKGISREVLQKVEL